MLRVHVAAKNVQKYINISDTNAISVLLTITLSITQQAILL